MSYLGFSCNILSFFAPAPSRDNWPIQLKHLIYGAWYCMAFILSTKFEAFLYCTLGSFEFEIGLLYIYIYI